MARQYNEDRVPSVYNLDDIPKTTVHGDSTMQVFRGLGLMVGFSTLDPEIEQLSPYSHPWEQITFVRRGSCELLVGDETTSIEAGDVFTIPPGTDHAVKPTSDEECELIDVWPLVENYLDQTAYQEEFDDSED